MLRSGVYKKAHTAQDITQLIGRYLLGLVAIVFIAETPSCLTNDYVTTPMLNH